MPRLPTIRVIGSHDISTTFRLGDLVSRLGVVTVAMVYLLLVVGSVVGRGDIPGGELAAAMPTPRLLVRRLVRHRAEAADDLAVERDEGGGHDGAGGFVHDGHELVGEAGHGPGNADAAAVWAAADARHPA